MLFAVRTVPERSRSACCRSGSGASRGGGAGSVTRVKHPRAKGSVRINSARMPPHIRSRAMPIDWNEPFTRFGELFAQATAAQPKDPNAVTLATVGANGRPSARVVLMKEYDARGFVVFTNYD